MKWTVQHVVAILLWCWNKEANTAGQQIIWHATYHKTTAWRFYTLDFWRRLKQCIWSGTNQLSRSALAGALNGPTGSGARSRPRAPGCASAHEVSVDNSCLKVKHAQAHFPYFLKMFAQGWPEQKTKRQLWQFHSAARLHLKWPQSYEPFVKPM